jgi:predicted DNA-binding protein with PD1-like motif
MSTEKQSLPEQEEIKEEVIEETDDAGEEMEYEVEFTTRAEAVHSACAAIGACQDFDLGMLNPTQAKRIKRIKRKSLRIIDVYIGEIYDEMFEDENNEDDE